MVNPELNIGENKTYSIELTNNLNKSIRIRIRIGGIELQRIIMIGDSDPVIDPYAVKVIPILAAIGENETPNTYNGDLFIQSANKRVNVPISLTIAESSLYPTKLELKMLSKKLKIGDTLKFFLTIYNPTIAYANITLAYQIKDTDLGILIYDKKINETLSYSKVLLNEINISNSSLSLGGKPISSLAQKDYFIEALMLYDEERVIATDTFSIVKPFWTPLKLRITLLSLLMISLIISSYHILKKYKKRKLEKSRYLLPTSFRKLPQRSDSSLFIGKVAETNTSAWFNTNNLVTHMLVGGATGSGKSVAASVFVEEVLQKKIPVVVFDPTSQWTGFVRPCKDPNLVRYYHQFGMKEEDARPFKGMIYDVNSPDIDLDFEKYMIPGEVTVFNLSRLRPGEYDQAVHHIVDTMFRIRWEEFSELRLLVVFDEVHRLLEKYGGKGGYIALERACREFRKWGIGIIMVSQVNADFKEAVQGNILTEVQLNTRAMEDIKKIEKKYGADYSQKITRQGVGVGMIQNPKYNDGKPWFVHFRPTIHSPHKISEAELKLYADYTKKLKILSNFIKRVKEKGKDTMELDLELKLAGDKLKEGHFKMAEIYINSLTENLKKEKKIKGL